MRRKTFRSILREGGKSCPVPRHSPLRPVTKERQTPPYQLPSTSRCSHGLNRGGWSIEVKRDDGIHGVAPASSDMQVQCGRVLRNPDGLTGQAGGPDHVGLDRRQRYGFHLAVEHVDINALVAMRGHAILSGHEGAAPCFVDALAVFPKPGADFLQSLHMAGLDRAVGTRAYI